MSTRWLALLGGCVLLLGAHAPPAHAGQMTPLDDAQLDEVIGAGLFFEINLQQGLMRVEIASRVQSLPLAGSPAEGTSAGTLSNVVASPVINAGNVALSGSAQQNLQALANVNAAGSVVQLLINILVVNVQNNSGTLNILQPQIAAFGF